MHHHDDGRLMDVLTSPFQIKRRGHKPKSNNLEARLVIVTDRDFRGHSYTQVKKVQAEQIGGSLNRPGNTASHLCMGPLCMYLCSEYARADARKFCDELDLKLLSNVSKHILGL